MATIEELKEKYWNFEHYLGKEHPETQKAKEEYYKALEQNGNEI